MEIKVERFVAQSNNTFGDYYNTVRNHFAKQYKGIVSVGTEQGNSVEELVTVTIGTTDSAATALVKVMPMYWNEEFCTYGKAKATGYGYHRASAAVESAFRNAGIIFNKSIGGRGDSAIKDAVQAVTAYVFAHTKKPHTHLMCVDVLEAGV